MLAVRQLYVLIFKRHLLNEATIAAPPSPPSTSLPPPLSPPHIPSLPHPHIQVHARSVVFQSGMGEASRTLTT